MFLPRQPGSTGWRPSILPSLARRLLDVGDFQRGKRVARARRRYPGDVWVNYVLALCLERLGRRDDAIRYYTAARPIQPVTAHELAHALAAAKEPDEAVAVFRDLKRLQPKNGRHSICMARQLTDQGRKDEAASELESTVAMLKKDSLSRPDDESTHFDLGRALEMQGKHDEAIAEYQISRRLRPSQIKAYSNLAAIFIDQGKLEEAITLCREALRAKPDAETHATLGNALSRQGKLEEAVVNFREAVRLRPDNHTFHENFGIALQDHGKFDEAITEFQVAIKLDPGCSFSRRRLGIIYSDRGELARAIAEFKEMIRLKPDDPDAYDRLGLNCRDREKRRKPSSSIGRPCGLRETSGRSHNSLAWAWPARTTVRGPNTRRRSRTCPKGGRARADRSVRRQYAGSCRNRVGHWNESIAASERSIALTKGGLTSDWFFLARCTGRSAQDEACKCFRKGCVVDQRKAAEKRRTSGILG